MLAVNVRAMVKISDDTNVERIEHKSKKNIALGSIFGYLSFFVSIIHGLVLTPLILNTFGKVDYGIYGLATSIIALLLLDFGLTNATNTYLARLRAKGDKDGVQRFLAAIVKLYFIIDIVFAIVIAVVYFLCPVMYRSTYTPQEIEKLQFLILIVGGFSIIGLPFSPITGVIATYEKFGFNKFTEFFQKVAYFGLTIACIKLNWGIIGITIVNVACGLFTTIVRIIYMRFYLNVKLDLRLNVTKGELRGIVTFSFWSLIYAIAARLVLNITPSILGIVSNSNEVALFTIVTTIEGYIYTFGAIANTFFLAKVARSDAYGSEEERQEHLQTLAAKIGKLQFSLIALIFLGFVTVGREFITVWLGPDQAYQSVYWCIIAICLYNVFAIPQVVLESAMFARGFMKQLAINSLFKAAINLTLSVWLSRNEPGVLGNSIIGNMGDAVSGAVGASISIMVARFAQLALDNYAYHKCLKISLRRFYKDVFLKGGICAGASLAFGVALYYFMPISNLKIKLLVNGFAFVVVYCLLIAFINFNKQERLYYIDQGLKLLHIRKVKIAGATDTGSVEVSENKDDGKKD